MSSKNLSWRGAAWLLIFGVSLSACVRGRMLLTAPAVETVDTTVPAGTRAPVSSLMVLPPLGSERGEASPLAEVERALLRRGFRVVSSGITGRVATDSRSPGSADAAASMSDLQRALILAQRTNADALLQVERASLSPRERAFAVVKGVLTEIDADPQNSIGAGGPAVRKKVVVDELVFEFRAKLIDVKSGDILLSVGGSQGTSTIEPVNQAVLVEANFREPTRVNLATPKRVKATIDAVLEVVFSHLQRPDAPAAAPPAAPVVSGSVSM